MPRKKKSGSAAWVDPDDAPELTDAFFDRAEIRHGNRVVRRGRPPLPNPKQAVKLRLDVEVLAAYRRTGAGWQTRINADLRKARKLKAGGEQTIFSFVIAGLDPKIHDETAMLLSGEETMRAIIMVFSLFLTAASAKADTISACDAD